VNLLKDLLQKIVKEELPGDAAFFVDWMHC